MKLGRQKNKKQRDKDDNPIIKTRRICKGWSNKGMLGKRLYKWG